MARKGYGNSESVRLVAPFKTPVSLESESSEAESSEAESLLEAESLEAESLEAESLEAESLEAESLEAESLEAESLEAESLEAESLEAESLEAESLEAESLEAESLEAESLEAESFEAESSEAESFEAESSEADRESSEAESHICIPVSPLSALDTRMFSANPTVVGTTKSSTQGPSRPKVIKIQVAEAGKENRDICPCTPIDDSQCHLRSTGLIYNYMDWRGKEWNVH
ncbi:uncharacterized abhydrolase domain-containing protein DDB_G0269086-like [Branchiostoma lanceolatum]|uniref:uncharacterized abhydrolase domain-containing protein DDB_G0269086-like n=1 Tax=Branchiostoma lanceolatum TaxID=7740 RepID=UPI00345298A9